MPISKRDLRRSLIEKFGFEKVSGSRHEALTLFLADRKAATARFSRAQTEIDDSILRLIARQLWVPLGYLKQMVACTKSREDYLRHLHEIFREED